MNNYSVGVSGKIGSLGKFKGQPRYAPYFWGLILNGYSDGDSWSADNILVTFLYVTCNDIVKYPELIGVTGIELFETDDGFVHCRPYRLR